MDTDQSNAKDVGSSSSEVKYVLVHEYGESDLILRNEKRCVVRMEKRHLHPNYNMTFPPSFQQHLPNGNGHVQLVVGCEARPWNMKIKAKSDGSMKLPSFEWQIFVNGNKIVQGDLLVFIFSKRSKIVNHVTLCVEIVKSGGGVPNIWVEATKGTDFGYEY